MARQLPTNFYFDLGAEDAEPMEMRERRLERQRIWLEHVGRGGWSRALEASGATEAEVWRWLRCYPEFAAAHRETMHETAQRLERIADEIAAGEREASAPQMQALQFRLRGLRPETYRERASVQVDAVTRVTADGDGGRARQLLAEWHGTGPRVIEGTARAIDPAPLPPPAAHQAPHPPNSSAAGT